MTKNKQIIARIRKELDNQMFEGYMGCAAFFRLDWTQFYDDCAGQLIIAIGANRFREEVRNVAQRAVSYDAYRAAQRKLEDKYKYERI